MSPSLGWIPTRTALVDLYDHLPDVAFFMKDIDGRYRAVNQSLVERVGLSEKSDLLGRTARETFPSPFGERYSTQDDWVMRTGNQIKDRLELHWYSRGRAGWCLTTKIPLRDEDGRVVGLVGISRDLGAPGEAGKIPAALGEALDYLESNFGESLTPTDLAVRAKLSPVRFARLIKRIFRLTPSHLITQTRLAAASRLLRETDRQVADIAVECGFYDHSAFTRAFRSATGSTPTEFRKVGPRTFPGLGFASRRP
jgi:PAS domain S-box-containing protein